MDEIRWVCKTRKGYMNARAGDGLVMERPYAARGTVQAKTSPTLTTGRGGGSGTVVRMTDGALGIRYLTPRECFRLMGQTDDAIDRIVEAEPSKTVQYRLAGNSIVVDVLEAIFKGIYLDGTFERPRSKQTSLAGWGEDE